MKLKRYLIALFALALSLTGCVGPFKPAPIAEGADPIVVHAERAQRSSLKVYETVTQWEFDNRASLPPEVSRAIDKYRESFKPAWLESRKALANYKARVGPTATDIERITAALLAAQDSLMAMKKDTSKVVQVTTSLTQLLNAIKALRTPTPVPVNP